MEERLGTISRMPEVLKYCPECRRKFWGRKDKDYKFCKSCGTKVGREFIIRGFTYIRLAQDDPYLSMCPTKTSVFTTGDWVRRGRYVMAQHLGRCLEVDEQIYHKNDNKLEDALENLELRKVKVAEVDEDKARKTRNYKFGYGEGYEVGYEEGYKEGQKRKGEEEINWETRAAERKKQRGSF